MWMLFGMLNSDSHMTCVRVKVLQSPVTEQHKHIRLTDHSENVYQMHSQQNNTWSSRQEDLQEDDKQVLDRRQML